MRDRNREAADHSPQLPPELQGPSLEFVALFAAILEMPWIAAAAFVALGTVCCGLIRISR